MGYLLIAEGTVQYRRGYLIAYTPLSNSKAHKVDGYYEEICPHITTALLIPAIFQITRQQHLCPQLS